MSRDKKGQSAPFDRLRAFGRVEEETIED